MNLWPWVETNGMYRVKYGVYYIIHKQETTKNMVSLLRSEPKIATCIAQGVFTLLIAQGLKTLKH